MIPSCGAFDLDPEAVASDLGRPDEHTRVDARRRVDEGDLAGVLLARELVDLGRRQRQQPTAERQHDDADRGLGAERAAEAVGERNGHLVGPIESVADLPSRLEPDGEHRRHRHRP